MRVLRNSIAARKVQVLAGSQLYNIYVCDLRTYPLMWTVWKRIIITVYIYNFFFASRCQTGDRYCASKMLLECLDEDTYTTYMGGYKGARGVEL